MKQLRETDKLLCSVKRVHMIGIGGISMSAIAEYLLKRGVDVCGYEYDEHLLLRRYEEYVL